MVRSKASGIMSFKTGTAKFRRQLFLNFKGGTGKTTLSAAYGLYLAEKGYRVLFVDVDPQGHLTRCLGINEWQFSRTLYHVLIQDVPVRSVVKKISNLSADLIPADISLSATELSLSHLPYREWRLLHALSHVKNQYDVVVADASPMIGILNLNAILAAKDLIIPVLPDSLSLHGLTLLVKTLSSIEHDFKYSIENIGILLNRFSPKEPHCREIHRRLRARYRDLLLRTRIRQCPELAKQPLRGRFGTRLKLEGEVCQDIEALVKEIAPLKDQEKRRTKRKGRVANQ